MMRLISRSVAGLMLLLVSASIARAQVSVQVTGTVPSVVSPSQSTFIATPSHVIADGVTKSSLIVTARDSNGDLLSGKFVTIFSSRPLSDTITCSGGSATTTTDQNGQATCTVASKTVGTSTFTAIVDTITLNNKPTVTFGLTITNPGPTPSPTPNPNPGPTPTPSPSPMPSPTPTPTPSSPTPPSPAQDSTAPKAALGLAIIAPIVLLLIPLTTSISLGILAGIPGLQYLIYSLIPAFRPKRHWGVVRDKQTRAPIPGVFVSLFSAETNTEIKRIITDRTGRFGFLIPNQGYYWVGVNSPLYEPYRSQVFDSSKINSGVISFDIELVALETLRRAAISRSDRFVGWIDALNSLQYLILLVGSAISIALFIRQQSAESSLLLAFYGLLWALRIILHADHRQAGLVEDEVILHGLPNTVIQVTSVDKKGVQSFIHSTISDARGRFIVLAPSGHHTIVAARSGYRPTFKETTGDAEDVALKLTPDQTPVPTP